VAIGSGDHMAYIVDTRDGKVLANLDHPAYVRRVAFSPDGQQLALAFDDEGEVRIYGGDRRQRCSLRTPANVVFGLDFSRDGQRLLVPCAKGTATLWDVSKPQGQLFTTLGRHQGKVSFAAFLPDGRTAATGGEDRVIRLRNVARPQ
jgi:WD40 repeat protein